ncbi:MAG: ACT domain-containing protein [Promethearchaeota archaeon]
MLKQISVFLPNQVGTLFKLTQILMDNNINMKAISVAETADFGILRILVDQKKTEECVKVLKAENYLCLLTDVIAVDVPDKPGALHEITRILAEERVNIEYLYSTLVKEKAIIVIRVDDIDKAVNILKNNGVKLIESKEF